MNLKEVVLGHARYRGLGPHFIDDAAPATVQRVLTSVCRMCRPDKWNSALGQPGFGNPSISW
eukprot:7754603-Lingulodinium_polyedra.AAC.1